MRRHRPDLDLVVVGLGSAGLVAAELAAGVGARVAAVERDRVGGDCLWTGCVPSKSLLAAARVAHAMRTADRFGLGPVEPEVDTARVWARMHAVRERIAATSDSPERLRAEGIDVRHGAAQLLGEGRVRVGAEVLRARDVVLATGSVPAVPPLPGLEEAGHLTSSTLFDRERAPASAVVLGGGPWAVELAQALVRLGVPTTLVERAPRLLPREEPELAARLTARLRAEGVVVQVGAEPRRVAVEDGAKVVHGTQDGQPTAWRGAEVLVATGRRVDVAGLGLDAAGVAVGEDGIVVDDRLRTSAPRVWAAGDATGRTQLTHAAGLAGARAVRNALFPGTQGVPASVPWCTFTDPELAHAGLTEREARDLHGDRDVRVWDHELRDSDRARAEDADEGLVRLVTARGRLVGAHVLAPGASELVHELVLAIDERVKLTRLADVVHPYPTIGTGIQLLGGEAALRSARRLRGLVALRRLPLR